MKMKRVMLVANVILFFCFWCQPESIAQQTKTTKLPLKQELPTVFLLGDYSELYEETMSQQTTLLDACNDDMKLAYSKLMGMMQEMEAYADLVDFDLKGINVWLHFFWDRDGNINHIGFYLKPNSKNVNTDLMKNFLEGFSKQYKFPLKFSGNYSHYSSFSFPIVRHSPPTDNSKSTAKSNQSRSSN